MKIAMTLAVLGLGFSAFAEVTEEFFHNRVYLEKNGTRLEFFEDADPDPADKGFKNCVIRWKDDAALFNCSWEYAKKEKALIVWVNGNRDWWDVTDGGKTISETGSIAKLTDEKPKKVSVAELAGRVYRSEDGSTELVLSAGKAADGEKACFKRRADRDPKEKPYYSLCSWEQNSAMTELTIRFVAPDGKSTKEEECAMQIGGRLLSCSSSGDLIQIRYNR